MKERLVTVVRALLTSPEVDFESAGKGVWWTVGVVIMVVWALLACFWTLWEVPRRRLEFGP